MLTGPTVVSISALVAIHRATYFPAYLAHAVLGERDFILQEELQANSGTTRSVVSFFAPGFRDFVSLQDTSRNKQISVGVRRKVVLLMS